MNKTALLLIDIQMEYFPGGALPLHNPEAATRKAQALLNTFREQSQSIVHIQHEMTEANAPFFKPGTAGQKTHPLVAPCATETVLTKKTPNSFYQTELLSVLKDSGVEELVLCGMMTHQCVNHTARAAKELGFKVTVISDACTTREHTYGNNVIPATQMHNAHIAGLEGFIATIYSTEQYIALYDEASVV